MNKQFFVVAVAAAMTALGGCAVGPDYQRPVLPMPASYPDNVNPVINATRAIPADWWTLYNDATLNQLVADAFIRNTDIKTAAAQLEEAEAVLRQANASLFPEIDLGATDTRSRVSSELATPSISPLVRNERRVVASTAFELDFWGKLRRATEAARAQMLASAYGREVVSLSMVSTTVQTYFTLRSLDAQITASLSSLKAREESLGVARDRSAAGLSSDLDVNQAEGARADLAAQVKELERQRIVAEHQLALITVNADLRIPRGDIQSLPIPPVPPTGLPSALLDRRPDVRVAEQNLVAANAQIGVAKAALFPTLSLTGFYGGQSAALQDLLSGGGRIWSAGFGLTLPIFDAGRGLAKVAQVESRQQRSLFAYQRTVAIAFREVADAITNVRQSELTEGDLQARVNAARNSLELAQIRYQSGYSPYLDVLDAQRTANDAELALVRNRQSRLAYSVDFMKSLGGGWNSASLDGKATP
ncbi:MAG: efflux transporter outer membrane subunit [Betaproteobacteria bacterium]